MLDSFSILQEVHQFAVIHQFVQKFPFAFPSPGLTQWVPAQVCPPDLSHIENNWLIGSYIP